MAGTVVTGTILDTIVADKREELEFDKGGESPTTLNNKVVLILDHHSILGDQRSLRDAIANGPRILTSVGQRVHLIGEVKVASPSKGRLIKSIRGYRWLDCFADTYTDGGACGVSVVTERKHFSGSLRYLEHVRLRLNKRSTVRPSLLRKDFLFDRYQIDQARAYGADAVLLIAAILEEELLKDLIIWASVRGMDSLVEVHNERELEMALRAGAVIIGINNRDLKTFKVDLATTERLRPLIPDDKLVVSESGIHSRTDVERLAQCDVDAILVGEALVTAPDVHAKMRELII